MLLSTHTHGQGNLVPWVRCACPNRPGMACYLLTWGIRKSLLQGWEALPGWPLYHTALVQIATEGLQAGTNLWPVPGSSWQVFTSSQLCSLWQCCLEGSADALLTLLRSFSHSDFSGYLILCWNNRLQSWVPKMVHWGMERKHVNMCSCLFWNLKH